MERKLVTVRNVDTVVPILGADKIEVCKIGGWNVVTGKGQFKQGDKALFYEIDSYLEIRPEYEFLRARCYKKLPDGREGMRLRTIKLKKVTSQGLLLPLSTFPNINFSDTEKDYSSDVGVVKYNPPENPNMKGQIEGDFPTYIVPKSDSERIQNLPDYFDKYKDVECNCSVKLDGTSATYIFYNNQYKVCSRNLELKTNEENKDNLYVKTGMQYNIQEKLQQLNKNIAIQGEICGVGVNGNPLRLDNTQLFVFNVLDIEENRYYTSKELQEFCKKLELTTVPMLGKMYPLKMTMDELLIFADKECFFKGDIIEGLVFTTNNMVDGYRLNFKVINNMYLLGEKE